MDANENFEQFDLVEIVEVPTEYLGEMDIGDVGVILDKYDDEHFEIECVKSDGSYKWLTPLHVRYFKLKSKDPYNIRKRLG